MRRSLITAFCVSIGVMLFTPLLFAAEEYFLTGNELYHVCQSGFSDSDLCLGYVMGVLDHWAAGRVLKPDDCPPRGVKNTQVRDVVVKYLGYHPELRNQHAWALVVQAIVRAWNCK